MTLQYSNLWVLFEALKFQMPRKSKNRKISSRTAGEKIKTRVSRFRKLALSERNNRGYFSTAKGRQTVTGRLLARFRKSDDLAWPSRLRIRAGLENELIFSLSQVSGTSQDVLEGNRSAAMMHARGVLFDELISESLIQAGWGRLNCMSYAHMAADSQAFFHACADWRVTPSLRATSAAPRPRSKCFAAFKRRLSIFW